MRGKDSVGLPEAIELAHAAVAAGSNAKAEAPPAGGEVGEEVRPAKLLETAQEAAPATFFSAADVLAATQRKAKASALARETPEDRALAREIAQIEQASRKEVRGAHSQKADSSTAQPVAKPAITGITRVT